MQSLVRCAKQPRKRRQDILIKIFLLGGFEYETILIPWRPILFRRKMSNIAKAIEELKDLRERIVTDDNSVNLCAIIDHVIGFTLQEESPSEEPERLVKEPLIIDGHELMKWLQDKSDARNKSYCPDCGGDDVTVRAKGSYCWDCGWKGNL